MAKPVITSEKEIVKVRVEDATQFTEYPVGSGGGSAQTGQVLVTIPSTSWGAQSEVFICEMIGDSINSVPLSRACLIGVMKPEMTTTASYEDITRWNDAFSGVYRAFVDESGGQRKLTLLSTKQPVIDIPICIRW